MEGLKVRPPAVAGMFYPADREELEALINFVCGEPYTGEKIKAKAVLVPHAGYIYSGKTACEVYKRIEIPEHVVILGPNHTGMGAPVSVYDGDAWETPFGGAVVYLNHLEDGFNRVPLGEDDLYPHAGD